MNKVSIILISLQASYLSKKYIYIGGATASCVSGFPLRSFERDMEKDELKTLMSRAPRKAFASFGNREGIVGVTEIIGHLAVTASRH